MIVVVSFPITKWDLDVNPAPVIFWIGMYLTMFDLFFRLGYQRFDHLSGSGNELGLLVLEGMLTNTPKITVFAGLFKFLA